MLCFVGLGNPGPEHARNRHNIGFMALDAIAHRYGFASFRARFHGLLAQGTIGGRSCFAFKPATYMNRSGIAVGALVRFFRIPLGEVVVFHDEIDLAPGKVRAKRGGGNAGHNGLRSLDAHLGPGYRRVRLGVGHPGEKDRVHGHVLKNFGKAEGAWVEPLIDAVAEAAPLLALVDDPGFMTRVALLTQPPKKEPRAEAEVGA